MCIRDRYYGKATNIFRREESLEKAREVDTDVMAVWTGTPHMRIIDNSTDFDTKLKRLCLLYTSRSSIPMQMIIRLLNLAIRFTSHFMILQTSHNKF